MATQLGTCYLLCIQPPYHHAAHYAGWTADADPTRRIGEHLAGRFEPAADGALRYVGCGSPLVAAALAAGRRVDLVLAVPGDRGLERTWHNLHGTRICPRCRSQRPPRPRQYRLPFTRPPAPYRGGCSRPWRTSRSWNKAPTRAPISC